MTEQFKKVVEHIQYIFEPTNQEDFIHLLVDILEYISIFISEGESFDTAFENAFDAVKEDIEQQLTYESLPLSLNTDEISYDVTLSSIDLKYESVKQSTFKASQQALISELNWYLN